MVKMEVYYANGRYFCGICSAGTRTKNVMIQHISMTHVEVNHIKFSVAQPTRSDERNTSNTSAQNEQLASAIREYSEFAKAKRLPLPRTWGPWVIASGEKCWACQIPYGNSRSARQHGETVHRGHMFQCQQCGEEMTQPGKISRHYGRRHKGIPKASKRPGLLVFKYDSPRWGPHGES